MTECYFCRNCDGELLLKTCYCQNVFFHPQCLAKWNFCFVPLNKSKQCRVCKQESIEQKEVYRLYYNRIAYYVTQHLSFIWYLISAASIFILHSTFFILHSPPDS